jgi:thiol-disulfide isomerase/thioredoxin
MTPRRRRWLLAGAGLGALAAGAGFAWLRYRPEAPDATAAVFGRVFDDADGRPQALSQWRGRWIVLNFWATWCAPCVEEMPTLQQAARNYGARGVTVVGVGIDNAGAIRRFRDELKLDLPLLVAGVGGSELARELGNPSGSLPYTVLISPQGRIEQAHLGLLKPELLRSWLDARLTG